MENKTQKIEEQTIVLKNRNNLSIEGTTKIISLKPDLIQLETTHGGLIIAGSNLELTNLNSSSTKADVTGQIDSLKFTQTKTKQNLFGKIFK